MQANTSCILSTGTLEKVLGIVRLRVKGNNAGQCDENLYLGRRRDPPLSICISCKRWAAHCDT